MVSFETSFVPAAVTTRLSLPPSAAAVFVKAAQIALYIMRVA
jgi:hypothetical protein